MMNWELGYEFDALSIKLNLLVQMEMLASVLARLSHHSKASNFIRHVKGGHPLYARRNHRYNEPR